MYMAVRSISWNVCSQHYLGGLRFYDLGKSYIRLIYFTYEKS